MKSSKKGESKGMQGQGQSKSENWFSCPDCHSISKVAGECPECGQPMSQSHVAGKKGGTAYLCVCPSDCDCAVDQEDSSKCSCGEDLIEARSQAV